MMFLDKRSDVVIGSTKKAHQLIPLLLGLGTPLIPSAGYNLAFGYLILTMFFLACTGPGLTSLPKIVQRSLGLPWIIGVGCVLLVRVGFTLADNNFDFTTRLGSIGPLWPAISSWGLWLCFFILLGVSSQRPSVRAPFVRGVVYGTALASCVAVLQRWYGDLPAPFALGSFWSAIHRVRGTFTDPNAFGVMVAVLLPFLVRRPFLGLFIGTTALLSGSRTLLLGVCLFGCWSCLDLVAARGRSRRLIVTVAVVVLASAFTLLQLPIVSQLLVFAPESVARTLATLRWETAGELLYSRLVFWEIALRIWSEFPLFGVGYGNFGAELPSYTALLGIDLGGWLDNANSFYLGILAEQGAVGALLLIATFVVLRRNPVTKIAGWAQDHAAEVNSQAPRILAILAVLLLLGPHLDFIEISAVIAVIGGGLVTFQDTENGSAPSLPAIALITACFVLGGVWYETRRDRGVWAWEREGDRWYRWSNGNARVWVDCPKSKSYQVAVRSLFPPGSTDIDVNGDQVSLLTGQWKTIEGTCKPGRLVPLRFTVASVWRPRDVLHIADDRLLGIQISTAEKLSAQEQRGVSHHQDNSLGIRPFLRWRSLLDTD